MSAARSPARALQATPLIISVPLADFLKLPAPGYLVKHFLPRRGVAVVVGESGSAKTFWVYDLACAVARGRSWRGRRGQQAGVVYLVSEGIGGFGDRVRAYLKHHGLGPEDIPLEVVTMPVDLLNDADVDALITAVRDAAERIGAVGMVVIDTLNRTMPGGDENSPEDMSRYIANATRLAEAVRALVVIVHHMGKDPGRGARGHSSLKAAVDVEIEITAGENDERIATLTKSRDFEAGASFGFRLEVVELGVDADGDPVTSCVVVPIETAVRRWGDLKLSGADKQSLLALRESTETHGEVMTGTSTIPPGVRAVRIAAWREQFGVRYGGDGSKKPESVTRAFNRAKDKLLKHELIAISDPYVWQTDK